MRAVVRIAVLRPGYDVDPGFGDFSQTLVLYRQGQRAAERFLAEHWLGGARVRPGVMEFRPAPAVAAVAIREQHARRLRSLFESVHHRSDRQPRAKPTPTTAG